MIQTKNNFIEFGFDPFKFIEDGLKIVTDNNLRSEATERNVTGGYSVFGKEYNWYGYKSSSTKSFAEQFDINSGLGSFLDQD